MQRPRSLRPSCFFFVVVATGLFGLSACDGGTVTDDPRADHLRINEVMPANAASCLDGASEADDWLELFNDSDADIEQTIGAATEVFRLLGSA